MCTPFPVTKGRRPLKADAVCAMSASAQEATRRAALWEDQWEYLSKVPPRDEVGVGVRGPTREERCCPLLPPLGLTLGPFLLPISLVPFWLRRLF